ncbi:MAG: hypothetical protein JW990_06440, partial [Thermoleophilia bacterium]|nr:hypothetical protein [Thermoleophilia bacterium]
RRRSPNALRAMAFAAIGLVLAAAVGSGIYAAVEWLDRDRSILVIGDGTTPDATGLGTPSESAASMTSDEAYALGEALLLEIPGLGFEVRRAWGTVTREDPPSPAWIALGPDEPMRAYIDIYIQPGLAEFPDHALLAGEVTEITIPGAAAARAVASPDGDYYQVVALTPDGTCINAISSGTLTDDSLIPPPIDLDRLAGLVGTAIAWTTGGGETGTVAFDDEVSVLVPVPQSINDLDFGRFWTILADAADVEPEGATLESFEVFYRRSGSIYHFNLQVFTADRYLLETGYGEGSEKTHFYGGHIPDDASLPRSSWSTPLESVFAALDRLGIGSFEAQLEIDEDVMGFSLSTHMRDAEGVAFVGDRERAFYYQNGAFIRLDPDDVRRYAGPDDVVLGMGLAREEPTEDPKTTKGTIDDYSYFIIPAGEVYPPEQMPDDFGFVAGYGVMGRNEIDTFAGTLAKDLGLREDRVTTGLRLSEDVLESLYRDLVMIEIQWYTFSDGFAPDADPENTGTSIFVTPHSTYRLEWSAGGFEAQPLEWEDSSLSQAPEAVALRKWFGKLQAVIELSPEWQALPPMTGGYL